MNALYLIFYISIAVWFLSEVYYSRKLRSRQEDRKKDRSTLNILWLVIIPSVFTAVFISKTFWFPIKNQFSILYLGEICILAGTIFRLIIIRSLGKYFTVDVT